MNIKQLKQCLQSLGFTYNENKEILELYFSNKLYIFVFNPTDNSTVIVDSASNLIRFSGYIYNTTHIKFVLELLNPKK